MEMVCKPLSLSLSLSLSCIFWSICAILACFYTSFEIFYRVVSGVSFFHSMLCKLKSVYSPQEVNLYGVLTGWPSLVVSLLSPICTQHCSHLFWSLPLNFAISHVNEVSMTVAVLFPSACRPAGSCGTWFFWLRLMAEVIEDENHPARLAGQQRLRFVTLCRARQLSWTWH